MYNNAVGVMVIKLLVFTRIGHGWYFRYIDKSSMTCCCAYVISSVKKTVMGKIV